MAAFYYPKPCMKNPYLSLLRTSWRYAGHERKRFALIYLLFFCAHLIALTNPLLFGWFVGRIQTDGGKTLYYTALFTGAYFGMKLLEWSMHGPARVMERSLGFNIGRAFLQERYHQVLHLPARWHQDNHSGATIDKVQKAYNGLRNFYSNGFMYFYTLIRLVFSVAAILYFSPWFGSVAVALGFVNIAIISRFDKKFIATLKEVNKREHGISAALFDSLSNIRTVITLRLEGSMERRLMGKVRQLFRPFRSNTELNEWKWFTAEMVITVIYCVVVLGYVYQHWSPAAPFEVAGLVVLIGYVNQFTNVFQNVAGQYTNIMQYHTFVQGAAGIEEAYEQAHRARSLHAAPQSWRELQLSQIRFSHAVDTDGHKPQHLHDVHLRIKRGQKVALIGSSGSGKSTLLNLLRGLYQPEGNIHVRIDGVRSSLDDLQQSVTLFPQDPEIFENTIAYNITMGMSVDVAEVMRACHAAHFEAVLEQMPDGLSTNIREKGVNLSGGQKQRLALARGILAATNSHLVLLDEPTSSVDPKTEVAIYKNLFAAFADKAVVSSIHRLHLLPLFDYIYVMEGGCIVAEGSFEDLHNSNAHFQNLWEHAKTDAAMHSYE